MTQRTPRPLHLSHHPIKSALSSSFLTRGSTSVVCGIRAALLHEHGSLVGIPNSALASNPPHPTSPFSLKFQFSTQKSFHYAKQTAYLTEILEKMMHVVVPVGELRVPQYEQQWMWHLDIDVTILETDGCLLDVAWIGILDALMRLKLPLVKIDEDLNVTLVAHEDEAQNHAKLYYPLKLAYIPVITSFAHLRDQFLIDPNDSEERMSSSTLSIALDENRHVHFMYKPGGVAMTDLQMQLCMEQACENTIQVCNQLRDEDDTGYSIREEQTSGE